MSFLHGNVYRIMYTEAASPRCEHVDALLHIPCIKIDHCILYTDMVSLSCSDDGGEGSCLAFARNVYHTIYIQVVYCNSISALTIKPWLGAERLLLVSDLNTNKTTTTITSGLRRLGFYMDHRVTGSCLRDS